MAINKILLDNPCGINAVSQITILIPKASLDSRS